MDNLAINLFLSALGTIMTFVIVSLLVVKFFTKDEEGE